jgi:hypothetical protein
MFVLAVLAAASLFLPRTTVAQSSCTYLNSLGENREPLPILADHPDFVEPLVFERRFLAPPVVHDENADMEVRSWRYWYNARGIIEMVNRLDSRATAIIDLMAWGVGDGAVSQTGVVLAGTPEKNALFSRQIEEVINPFLERIGGRTALVGHTLPGIESRSVPLARTLRRLPNDLVFSDAEGYGRMRDSLRAKGIRHILVIGFIEKPEILPTHPSIESIRVGDIAGKQTDRPGIEQLGKDFNVFLVGDTIRTTFPASTTPRYASQAALARLSGGYMITQASWVRMMGK